MLLTQVRDYMRLKKQATLDELAASLNIDKKVIEHGLGYWQKKGFISKQDIQNCNTTCSNCNCVGYIWIERSQSGVKL